MTRNETAAARVLYKAMKTDSDASKCARKQNSCPAEDSKGTVPTGQSIISIHFWYWKSMLTDFLSTSELYS